MASRNLTGPYRMRHLRLNAHTVATNKAPMGPYRGVARPGATFALERLVDEMARELHREPFDLRRQNIVTSAELPYRTAAGMKLDTGDYVAALEIARDKIDLPAIRKRQARGESDGRKIGVGFAFYTEQSGHGIVEFAKALQNEFGVELVSTGGTAKALREAGLTVKDISDLTGFPEMMDGRVKTLHPLVHGGFLALRDNPDHLAAMKAHNIQPIDLIVVNLYPFEATVARPDCTVEQAI